MILSKPKSLGATRRESLQQRYLGSASVVLISRWGEARVSPCGARAIARLDGFELVLDGRARSLRVAGRPSESLASTDIPRALLEVLLARQDHSVSREALFEAVWGQEHRGKYDDRRLSYNVSRLRRLLGESPRRQSLVQRTRAGYRLSGIVRALWMKPLDPDAREQASPRAIAAFIAERGRVGNRELRARFGLSRSGAVRALAPLLGSGTVRTVGRGRGAHHTISTCNPTILSV
ncbi:MAG: winged helix-turn-helix domain-containing protein [Candidatus Wallbacteria bacterium]|nr:winged helix-turn-helix domain-containing protein [Candidatus Wallbacteria bacterium]